MKTSEFEVTDYLRSDEEIKEYLKACIEYLREGISEDDEFIDAVIGNIIKAIKG